MRITLKDIYQRHKLSEVIPTPEIFIDTYNKHNNMLWASYQKGAMKKEVLRFKRFEVTLKEFGIKDKVLASVIGDEYIDESPKKTALIPHSIEVLDYLYGQYNLHIITNGFNEVQFTKLQLCGIDKYFNKVITSEMSGYHKPRPEAFRYALSSANAQKAESIMIGDDIETDIAGAQGFGISQIYFNPQKTPHSLKPTYEILSLKQIMEIL